MDNLIFFSIGNLEDNTLTLLKRFYGGQALSL